MEEWIEGKRRRRGGAGERGGGHWYEEELERGVGATGMRRSWETGVGATGMRRSVMRFSAGLYYIDRLILSLKYLLSRCFYTK